VMAAKKQGNYVGGAPGAHYMLFRTENVTSEYLVWFID